MRKPGPILTAKVTFLSASQGGFLEANRAGFNPQIKIGADTYTSCIVVAAADVDLFEPAIEQVVYIELLFWELYGERVHIGMPFDLTAGDRLLASGVITDVAD